MPQCPKWGRHQLAGTVWVAEGLLLATNLLMPHPVSGILMRGIFKDGTSFHGRCELTSGGPTDTKTTQDQAFFRWPRRLTLDGYSVGELHGKPPTGFCAGQRIGSTSANTASEGMKFDGKSTDEDTSKVCSKETGGSSEARSPNAGQG